MDVRRRPAGDRIMTKIQIELPDATAEAARDAGLLTSEALDRSAEIVDPPRCGHRSAAIPITMLSWLSPWQSEPIWSSPAMAICWSFARMPAFQYSIQSTRWP
jgi:hypothetical protein